MIACADFETITTAPTRVWAFSICEIGNISNFIYGDNIDDFMKICASEKTNHTFYFHNLAFDGEFIFYWLYRNNFKLVKDRKEFKDNTFCTLISNMGVFYSIEICFKKRGHKINKVSILDSLKILNFSVEEISKGFNLPVKKLEIPYEEFREIGHELTEAEIAYIHNDVEIVARALKYMFDLDMNKMTIGADALSEYKNLIGKERFAELFPIPSREIDDNIRNSYKGGFTYLDKRYKGKEVKGGIVLDKNSLYPSVMYECPLPYGEPIFFKGKYKKDDIYNLYVQTFTCQFKLKKNHIPSIQIKHTLSFIDTEYLESSGDEEVTLCLTSVDLKLFFEQYEVYNIEYINGYKFKSSTSLFKVYIDKWIGKKIQAKKEHNKAMYKISKLMLNSLYGKFSLSPKVQSKYPVYEKNNDKIHYINGEWEDREPVYIAVGTFITSWARYKTITSAQICYDRFIYADTDSLHLIGLEMPQGLEIDDYKLGAWKNEFTFSRGKYVRQKTYMELGKEPSETCDEYVKITCAGMPARCYKNVNFENFKIGSKFTGKLQRARVQGGIILKEIEFSIRN